MYTKNKAADPFYTSKKWKHKREAILRRDGYMDVLDRAEGLQHDAQIVHHIFPREMYPQYRWCDWNLISLTRENHEAMHDRLTGGLSIAGRKLMMRVAAERGIKAGRVTLVVGLPGSGKSTWARMNLGGGLAYDLDYIAAAFRLRPAHAEYHGAARRMANGMARAFVGVAQQYAGDVTVIRTAPSVDEAADYEPDRIVICEGAHDVTRRADYRAVNLDDMQARIDDLAEWAEANGIEILHVR